jgi:uncharacterized protein YbjT (DUF2867 family)
VIVAVTGGTGTLGREVAGELLRRGHEVRQLSRRPPEQPLAGAVHRSVDVTTGVGLGDAVAGAHAVVDRAFGLTARAGLLPAARLPLQPIDAGAVARVLADTVEGPASHERVDIAGPEVLPLGELARRWRSVTRRRALLVPVPLAGAAGRALRRGALTAPGAAIADSPPFDAWLRRRR